MKVWITKYALSKGILEIEVERVDEDTVKTTDYFPTHFHGKNEIWHTTRESAILKTEEMRKRKIEILKKSIERYENMKFE